ncbi:hypothetical protein [Arthrobacter sp. NicSoilC12]|uniref:hypothetical protein n=1 Tax=Arthrobacter sp. NicSoilC12 TaxID=2831001 RepID=UPI001CC81AAB|nr:hypothetical protein [Arthrobacter sp. NicSoilC12]
MAARTAAAKDVSSAGVTAAEQRALAAAVRALPKPSVAAWAVNMLAVHSPEILRELAALGTSMQAAQDALDAADLRRLAQQRRQLLGSTVKAAQALAARHGRAISAAVATEVEQTLRAATADPGPPPPCKAAACSGRSRRTGSTSSISPAQWLSRGAMRRRCPALEPRLERPASAGQNQRPAPTGQNRRTGPHSVAQLPAERRQRNNPASGPSARHG